MSVSFGEQGRAVYAKVWKIEIKDRYVKAQISTSRKLPDGTYSNSSWFASFLGSCVENAKLLKPKDSIKILAGALSTSSGEDKKSYTNMAIFAFELPEYNGGQSAPRKEITSVPDKMDNGFYTLNEDDEDLPF